MKKFILRSLSFFALLGLAYGLLAGFAPNWINYYYGFAYDYMLGIRTKHQRAASIEGPKIIFAGGSNLAYGLDSEMIEDSLAIPVVNLGLHGGLGVPFMVDQADLVAQKGDIIVFSIEYFVGNGDYRLLQETCSIFPELAPIKPYSWKKEILSHLEVTKERWMVYLGTPDAPHEPQVLVSEYEHQYILDNGISPHFNKYGDYIAHLGMESWYSRKPDQLKNQYRYWDGIETLNDFSAQAREKGVHLFFSYAPLSKTSYEIEAKAIQRLHRDMQDDLDIELLDRPEDFVFEDSLLYDRECHLIREGRATRTQRVIQHLRRSPNARKCLAEAARSAQIPD